MGMGVSASIRFGHCELQPHERRLLIHGEPAVLGARAFDVLLALAQRAGELVGKNELMDIVWPDVVVEENTLQVQISTLRKLLGPEAIATIPGRGYRFTVRIQEEAPPTVEATAGARRSPWRPSGLLTPRSSRARPFPFRSACALSSAGAARFRLV